ncbi:MAG: redoxin domain-containing protein [Candidatus Poribacteria bacterium]|nr:redoxin domain-containing protein [Candidatus Poribacteria bacterium]
MKQTQTFTALVFSLLAALACGTADNPVSNVTEFETSETPLPESEHFDRGQGLRIGSQAPEFELSDGYGNLHALSDYLGNDKKIIIVFYRTGG